MGIARNIKIGQRLHREGHSLLAKVMKLEQKIVYSCDIPYQASLARNVYFDHNCFGCVINQRAVIEGPCEIQHAVTLGELEAGGPVPVIRKGAYIGAKATILGGVVVGENAKVGAGALVLCDVPAGKTAVGVPAKII